MELHNLKPAEGSIKKGKRIGRGEGSKRGGTSTRGHKGAKSRSGYSKKSGFEGGQQPLQRRVPKFGFTSPMEQISHVTDFLDCAICMGNYFFGLDDSEDLKVEYTIVLKKIDGVLKMILHDSHLPYQK